ncbi:BED zinc finger [Popillia japonica]|uniref:BED zinc finger n=1 Tax=Popillia japonica TaxID=7064 RepID=A0AAW1M2K3_POPJA
MRPGAKKSVVSAHFKKSADGKLAICAICNKSLKYWNNTSNLKQHLARIHPTVLNQDTTDLENAEGSPIPGPSGLLQNEKSVQENQNLPPPSKKSKQLLLYGVRCDELSDSNVKEINNALIKMITRDYQPLSIVEDEGFIGYSHKLQPLYKIPSRKTLSSDMLPTRYAQSVTKLRY